MKRKLTIVTSAILTVYTSFTLVDTFMLQHSGTAIATSTQTVKKTAKKDSSTVKKTATSYENSHMSINVTTERVDDTTVYVADITVDDPSLLQTALANNTYGRNYTEKRHRWQASIMRFLRLMVIIMVSAILAMLCVMAHCIVILWQPIRMH